MYERITSWRRNAVIAALALAASAVLVYTLASEYVRNISFRTPGTLGDACPDPSAQQKNPNETLFVGCSGYLE